MVNPLNRSILDDSFSLTKSIMDQQFYADRDTSKLAFLDLSEWKKDDKNLVWPVDRRRTIFPRFHDMNDNNQVAILATEKPKSKDEWVIIFFYSQTNTWPCHYSEAIP